VGGYLAIEGSLVLLASNPPAGLAQPDIRFCTPIECVGCPHFVQCSGFGSEYRDTFTRNLLSLLSRLRGFDSTPYATFISPFASRLQRRPMIRWGKGQGDSVLQGSGKRV